ncbi:SdpI family protein [Halpernia frigidisoli]|uniref:SdpI/YhfL protein family protein n=1 Tax=Halpernia frigidisoli TaxID=1125876 RepID=A0A1I3IH12_9FLAO|nr:SdpI family protein [Halpernia frigidisoli]SFI47325.1 SdpI/YhfL protein family protein [Halpernia frigidisoli]
MAENIQNILIFDLSIFSVILLFYFYKPKEINYMIGYRTKLSMKNEKNWEFAQSFFTKKWIITIPIILITQIPVIFGVYPKSILIISGVQFTILSVYAIIITEKELKKLN